MARAIVGIAFAERSMAISCHMDDPGARIVDVELAGTISVENVLAGGEAHVVLDFMGEAPPIERDSMHPLDSFWPLELLTGPSADAATSHLLGLLFDRLMEEALHRIGVPSVDSADVVFAMPYTGNSTAAAALRTAAASRGFDCRGVIGLHEAVAAAAAEGLGDEEQQASYAVTSSQGSARVDVERDGTRTLYRVVVDAVVGEPPRADPADGSACSATAPMGARGARCMAASWRSARLDRIERSLALELLVDSQRVRLIHSSSVDERVMTFRLPPDATHDPWLEVTAGVRPGDAGLVLARATLSRSQIRADGGRFIVEVRQKGPMSGTLSARSFGQILLPVTEFGDFLDTGTSAGTPSVRAARIPVQARESLAGGPLLGVAFDSEGVDIHLLRGGDPIRHRFPRCLAFMRNHSTHDRSEADFVPDDVRVRDKSSGLTVDFTRIFDGWTFDEARQRFKALWARILTGRELGLTVTELASLQVGLAFPFGPNNEVARGATLALEALGLEPSVSCYLHEAAAAEVGLPHTGQALAIPITSTRTTKVSVEARRLESGIGIVTRVDAKPKPLWQRGRPPGGAPRTDRVPAAELPALAAAGVARMAAESQHRFERQLPIVAQADGVGRAALRGPDPTGPAAAVLPVKRGSGIDVSFFLVASLDPLEPRVLLWRQNVPAEVAESTGAKVIARAVPRDVSGTFALGLDRGEIRLERVVHLGPDLHWGAI